MQKKIHKAKIALLTCSFETPKIKTKHSVEIAYPDEIKKLHRIEQNYFVNMIKRCKDSGVNFIVSQWGFDDEANHLLMHHDLPSVRWIGGVDLELIAVSTGARIIPRFQELSMDKLGGAKFVREISFGNSSDKAILIEGCPQSRSVTIMIRGSSKIVVDEAARSIYDALCIARNLMRSNKLIYGGGSAELSCSLTVLKTADITPGVIQYAMKAFADALDQIPLALAENSGLDPIKTLTQTKARHRMEQKSHLGVDCVGSGTADMDKQKVFETLVGKKHQMTLATQACKMILKIDDVIKPNSSKTSAKNQL
jgi:T-complex protein 1 subunit epsilon